MNKHEAIKELRLQYLQTMDKAIDIVANSDTPEKPVVPQFVADWIESSKDSGFSLSMAMGHWNMGEKLEKWMQYSENQEIFAKAWLYGYTVEKPKLYTVEIPNPNNTSPKYKLMLVKGINGLEILRDYHNEKRDRYISQLTEEEIRKDFEWAWKWAKPVPMEVE